MQNNTQDIKLQLNETAYELMVTSIKNDINNIKEVFVLHYQKHTIALFNVIKQSDTNNIDRILEPLQRELVKDFPSVKIAILSCKRLNNLVTENSDEIISTYILDSITRLPDKNSIEFDNLFKSIKIFTENAINENINEIKQEIILQANRVDDFG